MAIVIGDLRAILGLDSSSFQRGLAQARSTLQGTGQSMRRIGQQMSLAVTVPLASVGVLSLKTAADFEASMNRVRAASGASAEEMAQIEAAALRMGETTQFRASQAGDAIEVLAKNGLDASQILGGALDASMLLAASSGADLAASGDLATDVMLQFGKSAQEITGLVDGMVGAMLASKFSFDDYRLAVAQAGGVAGGVGVEFEDFNAVIAGTSALFASGSDAGTAFKTFLQRLVPASAPAAAAMRDLNLEFFNADGSMKSMAEVAQELQDGLAGLSDEARNDALSTIFGTDALRTAIGLAEQGAEGIERLKVSIADTSAAEQAEARLQGLNGEMLKLQSALEALRIAIGNSGILEFATEMARSLTAFVLRLKDMNPQLLKWGVIIGGVAAAIGPLLIGFGLLIQGLGPILGLFKLLVVAVGAVSAPFAIAAAAIGAAAYVAWENWEVVGPWFTDLFTSIGDVFVGLSKTLGGIVTGDMSLAVDGLKQAWGGLQDFFQTLWDGVVAVFEAAWERLQPIVDKVKAAATSIADGINRVSGANKGPISSGYDPSTDPGDAGLVLPTAAGHIANGLAAGTSGMRDQGVADADAYGDGFREGMGIQSPSKRMMEYGEYLSQGLAIGVENDRDRVTSSMSRIGDGIVTVLEDAVFRGGNVMEGFRDMMASTLSEIGSGLFRTGASGLINSLFTGFGIPGFAMGGNHGGGWRIVGENGPELEATGAARYYSSARTRDLLGGGAAQASTTRVEIVPNQYFDARVKEVSDRSAAEMGVQVSKSIPGQIQEYNRNPRKRF